MDSQPFRAIRPYRSILALWLRLLDVILIGLTLWFTLASVEWDNKHTLWFALTSAEWGNKHIWWLFISVVGFGVFSSLNELYRDARSMSTPTETKLIAVSWFYVVLALMFVDGVFALVDTFYKIYFWIWSLSTPIIIIFWHVFIRRVVNLSRKLGKDHHRVAIVGVSFLGNELEKIFIAEDAMAIDFIGVFDDRKQTRPVDGYQFDMTKIVGDIDDLIKRAKKGAIDIVYITLPMRSERRIQEILELLSDTTVSVHYVPDLFVFDLLSYRLNNIKGIPVISVYDTPFYGIDGAMKRMFDIAFSSVVLIFIAVPMLIIAISIRLTSQGPVLFKQRRYGFRGEEFFVWKFRTMSVCEDGENIVQAKKNDPRITKLGGILRRTSLDELPQFFNVLQGRMSIVGPRPHAVAHNERYRGTPINEFYVKGYMLRHKVKPGITGLAQVSGYRGETDSLDKMQGRIDKDLYYIRNWSLLLDIKIVLLTIRECFTGELAH